MVNTDIIEGSFTVRPGKTVSPDLFIERPTVAQLAKLKFQADCMVFLKRAGFVALVSGLLMTANVIGAVLAQH